MDSQNMAHEVRELRALQRATFGLAFRGGIENWSGLSPGAKAHADLFFGGERQYQLEESEG